LAIHIVSGKKKGLPHGEAAPFIASTGYWIVKVKVVDPVMLALLLSVAVTVTV
jgi:hypothetical protein